MSARRNTPLKGASPFFMGRTRQAWHACAYDPGMIAVSGAGRGGFDAADFGTFHCTASPATATTFFAMTHRDDKPTALAPFRSVAFRLLWTTSLVANVCTWMSDVSAAWMMSSLTTAPLWVSLVQTASTLPVLLLGLPSGALADSLDRKRYLLATQIWVAGTASLLSAVAYLGWMTPPVLLALVFANGIGLAMRMPVLGAALPEVLPRTQLPAATALSAVSVNVSRILGPLLAGLLISSAGSAAVFLLNAILSIIAAWMVSLWKSEIARNRHGRERMFSAMRSGLQYVAQSSQLKGVLWRLGIYFHCATALMCMLPLLARQLKGGDAGVYTLLIASMGAGAIGSAQWLPRLRQRYSRDALVLRGTALQASAMIAMAVADGLWLAMPAMFIAGAAWITVGNTLTLASHQSLPNWVRARGISISQMTVMGASAMGAAVWGQIAAWTSVPLSLVSAAALALIAIAVVGRVWPDAGTVEDLTPRRVSPMHELDKPPVAGHVMVTIEYSVDVSRMSEFRALMLNESRSSRLRHGAISWELLHDLHEPGRFVEIIVDPSWNDYLRRLDRITNSDAELRDRRRSFHIGKEDPHIRHSVMESTVRGNRSRL